MSRSRPMISGWRVCLLPALAICTSLLAACAAKVPVVPPGPPQFQDFTYPDVPADLARAFAAAANTHQLAWQLLQAGDLRAAERQLAAALKQAPGFYPSEAALGYVEMARRSFRQAAERFARALDTNASYLPALIGRGQALLADGRDAEALAAFEAALAVDPSLAEIRQRVEVLKLRGLQSAIGEAQQAAREGRVDEAREAYGRAIAASPEAAFLYRELALVEKRAGATDRALEHLQRAVDLDPSDGASELALAELLEAGERWDEAIAAYQRAAALEAGAGLDERIERLRQRSALAKLPDAYRAIPGAERVTRGDLAALLGVRLATILDTARRPSGVVVTDARSHWAQPWISAVTRAGVMDVYANHTFQPNAIVRRSDLAQAVSRVLAVIAARNRALAEKWIAVRWKFPDLGPGHLAYPAASAAVAAGVLDVGQGEPFQPSRPVTGAEAVTAVSRLEELADKAGVLRGA